MLAIYKQHIMFILCYHDLIVLLEQGNIVLVSEVNMTFTVMNFKLK